jgi:hypothetical protein
MHRFRPMPQTESLPYRFCGYPAAKFRLVGINRPGFQNINYRHPSSGLSPSGFAFRAANGRRFRC